MSRHEPTFVWSFESRAAEKQASRDADERAVSELRLSRDEVDRKNAFVTAERSIVHWERAQHL